MVLPEPAVSREASESASLSGTGGMAETAATGEGHTSRVYDQAMLGLRMQLLEMGGLVLSQVAGAVRALLTTDTTLARDILDREQAVNAYADRVDRAAMALIALHQPVAGDLRTVRALTRAAIDLERVGDEAKKLAYLARDIAAGSRVTLSNGVRRPLRVMGQAAASMLHDAVDALDRMSAESAQGVLARDAELDAEFNGALRLLVTEGMEDPRSLAGIADAVLALKAIERIGDHAKNVAEQVAFIAG
jgi:phosphate transport system protein